MDMNMLETDVEKALDLLPHGLVMGVLNAIVPHYQLLARIFPELIRLLKPHVAAGTLEHQAGLMSMAELSATLMPVLQRYVTKHASPVNAPTG